MTTTSAPTGSPFALRGVIEGFYGRPWTHRQRLELLDFLAGRGMNAFALAPKDDPFLRRRWRDPHPDDETARMAELATAARDRGVSLMVCLSPGLSIRYSDPDDIALLVGKFRRLIGLGVTDLGLLLDDIPAEPQHPEDRARYRDLTEAHVDVINRVAGVLLSLPDRPRLWVCPTVYHGRGDEDYLVRLGSQVDPRVEMFHTGRAICSPTIDLADAAAVARGMYRPPTYWDNYPVNDVAMTGELHIGPYRGRDRHLYRFARGVLANGMELFESSKIAFATIADYLRDPEGYRLEASWESAVREVIGDAGQYVAFRMFADTVRTSCLAEDDAPELAGRLQELLFAMDYADPRSAADDLAEYADQMAESATSLLRAGAEPAALLAEARPWIEVFGQGAAAVRAIAEFVRAGRTSAAAQDLAAHRDRLRRSPYRVFGDLLDMTLTDLIDDQDTAPHAVPAGTPSPAIPIPRRP